MSDSYPEQAQNDYEHEIKDLERQLEIAKVNERDLNDIITALNDELSEKERRFKVCKSIAEEAIKVVPAHFDEVYGWSDSLKEINEKGDEETPT